MNSNYARYFVFPCALMTALLTGCAGEAATRLQAFCAAGASQANRAGAPAIARSFNAFSNDLYARTAPAQGNYLVSGYSMAQLLSMLHLGAKGSTRDGIATALKLAEGSESLHEDIGSLERQVLCGALSSGYDLSVANAIWAANDLKLQASYVQDVRAKYYADIRNIDFALDGGNAALKAINGWVSDMTGGHIKKLFEQLSSGSRVVLANAVYFKAGWALPFRPEATQNGTFYVDGTTATSIPKMYQEAQMSYVEKDSYVAVTRPYQGGDFAMVLFVPRAAHSVEDVQLALAEDVAESWSSNAESREVQLSLPKFRFNTSVQDADLRNALIAMGMVDAFSSADFSAMTASEGLHISTIVHKTFIEVNETGTTAAAASGAGMTGSGAPGPNEPTVVDIDRPFLFAIRDLKTGANVFSGRVSDPR